MDQRQSSPEPQASTMPRVVDTKSPQRGYRIIGTFKVCLFIFFYKSCAARRSAALARSRDNPALYYSSLSNAGHALQAGLVTALQFIEVTIFLLRTVFSLHQLYIHSYLSKTVAPHHLNFHFSAKNSQPNFISLSINFMSRCGGVIH